MSNLRMTGKRLEGTSFHGQYLNYENFDGIQFIRCDFRHVDAKLASFRDCEFVDCQFDNGNFQLAKFRNCLFRTTQDCQTVRNASFGRAIFDHTTLFSEGAATLR